MAHAKKDACRVSGRRCLSGKEAVGLLREGLHAGQHPVGPRLPQRLIGQGTNVDAGLSSLGQVVLFNCYILNVFDWF